MLWVSFFLQITNLEDNKSLYSSAKYNTTIEAHEFSYYVMNYFGTYCNSLLIQELAQRLFTNVKRHSKNNENINAEFNMHGLHRTQWVDYTHSSFPQSP